VGPGRVRVGITDFLQQHSGDAAFIRVKPAGTALKVGEDLAELETIKVNLALAAPASGTVSTVNKELDLSPELANQKPYDEGWLAELETSAWETERAALLGPEAYFAHMKLQAEAEL
jgi:glycine cleavage system H protein